MNKDNFPNSEYQYGFHDQDVSVYKTKQGLRKETVIEISHMKKEPKCLDGRDTN